MKLTGDSTFATRLYDRLRHDTGGNLFFSPASVRIALAMAWAGARGETAAEMCEVLALPAQAHDELAAQLRAWDALATPALPFRADADLAAQRRIMLRVASRLWAQRDRALVGDYVALLRDRYRAPLAEVDFAGAAEASRDEINAWVRDATDGTIAELIGPRVITADTRMVLTNAVRLVARWSQPFMHDATRPETFHAKDRDVRVPMMRDVRHLAHARIDGGQVLELPYAAGELVMDVVLPSARDGLARLEDDLARGALDRWLAALRSERVDVWLPRFTTEASFLLARALGALGMRAAFTFPGADFSGIDGTRLLFIGDVIHQARVDVDEAGTEASAATAVVMFAGSAAQPKRPIEFRADHPFLFLIRDARTDAIVFAGRLVDPSAAAA